MKPLDKIKQRLEASKLAASGYSSVEFLGFHLSHVVEDGELLVKALEIYAGVEQCACEWGSDGAFLPNAVRLSVCQICDAGSRVERILEGISDES